MLTPTGKFNTYQYNGLWYFHPTDKKWLLCHPKGRRGYSLAYYSQGEAMTAAIAWEKQ